MKIDVLRLFGLFFLLLVLQLLIFNNLQINGFINPYVYIIFIVLFPIRIKRVFHLLLSFLLGICIDLFSFTYGIHAFASVLIAYLRMPFLTLFFYRAQEDLKEITVNSLGISKFIVYSFILIIIHHIVLFQMEAFTFYGFFITAFKAIISSFFTLILFLIYQFIIVKKK